MPINRYQIRDVYSMADSELYKAADKDDPEALLEGVAMAGLVGVLRQLGDLAEFAAEIFDELHEEVTATAARGHGLLVRAQQLQLEIPSIERSFMSQTCHSAYSPNSGIDWHPKRQTTHNLITTGDLPRFFRNSYEECRGPPRLFLLDKFDGGGAGACLKRYTDPSFYKVEVSSYEFENVETQRDKKIRKNKKKDSQWKGGGTPEISPNSKAKLHQLFLEDRQNGTIEPTHRVKLKKRPNKSPFGSATRESYMNKLLNSPSDGKIVNQVPFRPSIIPVPSDSPSDSPNQLGFNIFKEAIASPFNLATQSRSPSVSGRRSPAENPVAGVRQYPSDSPNQLGFDIFKDAIASPFNLATQSRSPSVSGRRSPAENLAGKVNACQISDLTTSGSLEVDEEIKTDGVQNSYRSDDVAIEMDNYVDALGTMESELETVGEYRSKINPNINKEAFSGQLQSQFSDSELTGSTGIPFRPKVPLEKIPGISYGACTDVNQGVILEEGSEDDENVKNEEHQMEFLSPASSLLSFQFFRNFEGEVENEHPNDGSSPMICLPNILETTDRIREDNHSAELKERETGLANSKFEVVSTPVTVPEDVDRNDDKALSTLEDDTKLEGREEEPINPKMEKNVVLLPVDNNENSANDASLYASHDRNDDDDVVNGNDDNTFSTLDDTELEGTGKEYSGDLEEMKKSVCDTSLAASYDLNDDDVDLVKEVKAMTVTEKPPMLELPQVEEKDDPQLLFASAGSRFSSQSDSPTHADHETDYITHSEPYSVSLPSQSVVHEEDPQGKPITVSVPVPDNPPALELLQRNDHVIDLFGQVKHQFHSDPCSVNLASQSDEDPQGKPMTVSLSESVPEKLSQATSHGIGLFDQVKHQFDCDASSINLASQSKEDPQRKSITVSVSESVFEKLPTLELPQTTSHDINLFDQVKHQFHSDLYSLKLSSQCEEDPQGKNITVSVSENLPTLELPQAASHDTDFFDQVKHQFHSDPNSINLASQSVLPENPPALELPQAISPDIDLSDQVKHQLPPVYPGFSILPDIPPVKLEDTPPLPPLPPMQWRMRKLQSPSLSPTDGGQPSDNNFLPVFQSKTDQIINLETENENFEHEGCLHTQDHDKKSGSTEAKFAENLAPQEADEMPTNIRPMKIQLPRSPLIDAVATHDKSKMRKIAMSQITKGQENDKLMEQIRTKSYNLKPAVKTRPNIQGPATNVRLAAILEKANAIHQAFAGSDDDDDSDSWSDS